MDADRGTDAERSQSRPKRAAEYVRMSTEHQQYSTENQADIIRVYAAARGFEIVRTYADAGKSGLRIDGRNALKALIQDVESGKADFEAILVYDVSRWGRFQDADESAFYEHSCKRAGIAVHYCAEEFDNDGSPVSTIIKSVKRAMAGEYSRELSVKVFKGQCRHIENGHRQGGAAGFGLRRLLIDQFGNVKGELARGEQKSLQTDRVVLTLGPAHEVEMVRRIYRAFVIEGRSESLIAAALNAEGCRTDLDRAWTRGTVHQVLINEKYAGDNVWNRTSFKLKKRHVRNPPEMWVRANDAFPAVVERAMAETARTIIAARSFRLSDEEMLVALRNLLEQQGALSGMVIDETDGMPSSSAYRSRFGSLLRAYKLVGYTPRRDYAYVEINRALRALHPDVVGGVLTGLRATGCHVIQDPTTDLVSVNREFTVSVVIARCRKTAAGSLRWQLRFDTGLLADITVAVRMDSANLAPLDYYLLPAIDLAAPKLRLAEENGFALDAYRFDTLDLLYDIAEPVQVAEAA
ncbi:recombinase family protein [Aureimonas ureilytica]|nr:recombinase family protein [Aureimonas ureilytica]